MATRNSEIVAKIRADRKQFKTDLEGVASDLKQWRGKVTKVDGQMGPFLMPPEVIRNERQEMARFSRDFSTFSKEISAGTGQARGNLAAFSNTMLQGTRAAQDYAQGGIGGIMNNVIELAGALPGPLKAIGLIGTATGLVAWQWDNLTGKAKKLKAITEELARQQEKAARASEVASREAAAAVESENAAMRAQLSLIQKYAGVYERTLSGRQMERGARNDLAVAEIESSGASDEEKIRKVAAIRQEQRKKDLAEDLALSMQNADRLNAHFKELAAQRDAAQQERDEVYARKRAAEIEGKVSDSLQREYDAAEARYNALFEQARAADDATVAQNQQSDALRQQAEVLNPLEEQRQKLEMEKQIADLRLEKEKQIREERAQAEEQAAEDALKMHLRNMEYREEEEKRAAQAKKALADAQAETNIRELRNRGRDRAADRAEADRTETARVQQLRDQNVPEAAAREQAARERSAAKGGGRIRGAKYDTGTGKRGLDALKDLNNRDGGGSALDRNAAEMEAAANKRKEYADGTMADMFKPVIGFDGATSGAKKTATVEDKLSAPGVSSDKTMETAMKAALQPTNALLEKIVPAAAKKSEPQKR